MVSPNRPSSFIPSTMSVGYSSLCSSSVATGRIFSSTNVRTVLRISTWMSVRSSVSQRRPMRDVLPGQCGRAAVDRRVSPIVPDGRYERGHIRRTRLTRQCAAGCAASGASAAAAGGARGRAALAGSAGVRRSSSRRCRRWPPSTQLGVRDAVGVPPLRRRRRASAGPSTSPITSYPAAATSSAIRLTARAQLGDPLRRGPEPLPAARHQLALREVAADPVAAVEGGRRTP